MINLSESPTTPIDRNTLGCLNEITHASCNHDKALITCLSNTRRESLGRNLLQYIAVGFTTILHDNVSYAN